MSSAWKEQLGTKWRKSETPKEVNCVTVCKLAGYLGTELKGDYGIGSKGREVRG